VSGPFLDHVRVDSNPTSSFDTRAPAGCKKNEDPFRACHGDAAAGRFVYCGVYVKDEDAPAEQLTFKQMANMGKAQRARVEWLLEHLTFIGRDGAAEWSGQFCSWRAAPNEPATFDSEEELVCYLKKAGFFKAEDELDGEGVARTDKELLYRALHNYMEHRNPVYWRQPCRFVGYSEEVYEALVKAGATARDAKTGEPITVATNLDELGYL
jgi:hypothetical protein